MSKRYLDYDGLLYFWGKIKTKFQIKLTAGTNITIDPSTNTISADGSVDDVTVNGTSVVSNKVASISVPTKVSDLTNDSNYVSDASYVHTDENFSSTLKSKLEGIETGAEANVQSDWNQSDSTADDFIKNKPTIPAATSDLTNDSNFVVDASYVHTDTNYTSTDAGKVAKLAFSGNVIDESILPSYVDDVVEAYPVGSSELAADWLSDSAGGSAITPESGKIYILMTDSSTYGANTQFRWGGSAYVKLNDGGVTSITNTEIDTILAS